MIRWFGPTAAAYHENPSPCSPGRCLAIRGRHKALQLRKEGIPLLLNTLQPSALQQAGHHRYQLGSDYV